MPTSQEVVPNRPLSGSELKSILLRDFTALLESDGFLSSQVAYARVSYDLRVRVHMDNPYMPELSLEKASVPAPAHRKEESAVQPAPPLKEPSPEATVTARSRSRRIASPNAARVEHGLPVTVQVRDQAGHLTDKDVKYPAQGIELDPTAVTDTDESAQTAVEWQGRK